MGNQEETSLAKNGLEGNKGLSRVKCEQTVTGRKKRGLGAGEFGGKGVIACAGGMREVVLPSGSEREGLGLCVLTKKKEK